MLAYGVIGQHGPDFGDWAWEKKVKYLINFLNVDDLSPYFRYTGLQLRYFLILPISS